MTRSRYSSKSSKRRRSKKSKVRIPLRGGTLPGYFVNDPIYKRRGALARMIVSKHSTYSQVIKRLNVLAIYNKNRSPQMSSKIRKDIEYIQRHFKTYSKTFRRKSRTRTRTRSKSRKRRSYRKSRRKSRR